jgi:hypothetical protein
MPRGLRRGKASSFPTRPRPTRPPCLRGLTQTEARSAASAVARPPTSLWDQLRLNRHRRRRVHQEIDLSRKIDSSGAAVGYDSCVLVRRRPLCNKICQQPTSRLSSEITKEAVSRTTRLILLDRWTRHRSVGAEHTAIARLWFKPLATSLAVIEKLARIGWHLLSRLVPALRTGDCGCFNHGT